MNYYQMTFQDLDGLTPKRRYELALNLLDGEYETKKIELQIALRKSQVKCDHTDSTYYPDPSGNHDSWDECNYCGKIF